MLAAQAAFVAFSAESWVAAPTLPTTPASAPMFAGVCSAPKVGTSNAVQPGTPVATAGMPAAVSAPACCAVRLPEIVAAALIPPLYPETKGVRLW